MNSTFFSGFDMGFVLGAVGAVLLYIIPDILREFRYWQQERQTRRYEQRLNKAYENSFEETPSKEKGKR